MLRSHAFLAISLLFSIKVSAQTNIGGVVNIYTPVSDVSNCSCPTTDCAQITVSSSAGFAEGDRVLIIQMKGARVDSSNTSSHGSVINLYDAGNYEFATIGDVTGNVITTVYPLDESYFTNAVTRDSAYVQLIRVPVYSGDVNVTSTLKPQAWSASSRTGGVLAIELTGTLTLQANISADTLGFCGAPNLSVTASCGYDTAYYYQSTIANHSSCTGCGYAYAETRVSSIASFGGCSAPCTTNRMNTSDNRMAGFRGESIAANNFKKTFASGSIPIAYFIKGRGRWANGGGGGSNHNGGGGGGGNYGAGGWGGRMYNNTPTGCPSTTFDSRRGFGGANLTPTKGKVFMGGGGGGGHVNGGQGSGGTTGGGIIFISAASIANGGSYTISANAKDNNTSATGDGSGGGGAGGTILFDVSGSFENPITVSVKGGKGGDHSQSNCHGPGGGGGGGVIWFSESSLPGDVTTDVSGGANGTNVHAAFDCGTASWGATAGSSGTIMLGPASGAEHFFNMNTCSSPLPVQLVSFSAALSEKNVEVEWETATELNNDYFLVEKSKNGKEFTEVKQMDGAGSTSQAHHYSFTDTHPYEGKSYYRLAQVDYDGSVHYSQIVQVNNENKYPDIRIYPNPAQDNFTISIDDENNYKVEIISNDGQLKSAQKEVFQKTQIDCSSFRDGIFLVKISSDDRTYLKRIMIRR